MNPRLPDCIQLASPDVGEAEFGAVRKALESGTLTNGDETSGFEGVFARRHAVDHAVAFANGSVALTATYLALGISPGDEVIVPSMTFISSATSVLHVGAVPVFADVRADIFTLDPSDVASRITARTRAILAVHYGGQPADMQELADIAAGHDDVVLLEDAAQAHGAAYRDRPVGGLATAAMFSFTPTKNVTTGEGGMVTTNDGELAQRLRLLRNHGQVDEYRHELVGYNWRLTEMQAAMGRVQIGKLDEILARKRANAAWMSARLGDVGRVVPPAVMEDREHTYMLYTVLLERGRDEVMAAMRAAGVECKLYFPPAHLQPIFSGGGHELGVTEELASRMLSIPFHSRLSALELERIADTLESSVVRS